MSVFYLWACSQCFSLRSGSKAAFCFLLDCCSLVMSWKAHNIIAQDSGVLADLDLLELIWFASLLSCQSIYKH